MPYPVAHLRRCQACQLGNHELCTHSTTLGTPQAYKGVKVDACGCSCEDATRHREGMVKRAYRARACR